MTDHLITLEIPKELAVNAEHFGLLSRDKVIAWLQTEVKRHLPVTGDEPLRMQLLIRHHFNDCKTRRSNCVRLNPG